MMIVDAKYSLYKRGGKVLQSAFAICVCAIFCSFANGQKHGLMFTINKSWDGQSVDPSLGVTLNLNPLRNGDLQLDIKASYFGDPAPTAAPGLPFMGLWDFEVVEVFFRNDQNQYLEVELGPHGQHIVLLLNGEHNAIRHSLPLNVTTQILDEIWHGTVIIPKDYFPPQVTKFNAYSIHGTGDNRTYMALYPIDGSTTDPDFHNLNFFRPLNTNAIFPDGSSSNLSRLWESAIEGVIRYTVSRQWQSGSAVVTPSEYSLQGFQGGIEMNYTITEENTKYQFRYTVFTFENAKGEAIKITLLRNGKYILNFYQNPNEEYDIGGGFRMDYRIDSVLKTIDGNAVITGSVMIPPAFFPANVNLINIYALFGTEVKRVDASLETLQHLEDQRHSRTIDFDNLVESNVEYSPFWKYTLGISEPTSAIDEKLNATHKIISNEHKPVAVIKNESEITINRISKSPDVLEQEKPIKESIDDTEISTTAMPQINDIEIPFPTETSKISHKKKIMNKNDHIVLKNVENSIVSKLSQSRSSKLLSPIENESDITMNKMIPESTVKIQEVDEENLDYPLHTTQISFGTEISKDTESLVAIDSFVGENNDIGIAETVEETQINTNSFVTPIPDMTDNSRVKSKFNTDETINTERSNSLALEAHVETSANDNVVMDSMDSVLTNMQEIDTEISVTDIPKDKTNDKTVARLKLKTDLDDATALLFMPEITKIGNLEAPQEQLISNTESTNINNVIGFTPTDNDTSTTIAEISFTEKFDENDNNIRTDANTMETHSMKLVNEIINIEIPVEVNSDITEIEVRVKNAELKTSDSVTIVPELDVTFIPKLIDAKVDFLVDATTQISLEKLEDFNKEVNISAKIQEVVEEMSFGTEVPQASEILIAMENQVISDSFDGENNEITSPANNDIVTEETNEETRIHSNNKNINVSDMTENVGTNTELNTDEEMNTETSNALLLETYVKIKMTDNVIVDSFVTDMTGIKTTEMPVTITSEDINNDQIETKLGTDLHNATPLLFISDIIKIGDLKASEEQQQISNSERPNSNNVHEFNQDDNDTSITELLFTEKPNENDMNIRIDADTIKAQSMTPDSETANTEIPIAITSKINSEFKIGDVVTLPEIVATVSPKLTDLEAKIYGDATAQISLDEKKIVNIESAMPHDPDLIKADEQTMAIFVHTENTNIFSDVADTEVLTNAVKQNIKIEDISIPKQIKIMNSKLKVEIQNPSYRSGEEPNVNISQLGTEMNQLIITESSITETPSIEISEDTNQPKIVNAETPITVLSIIGKHKMTDNDRSEIIKDEIQIKHLSDKNSLQERDTTEEPITARSDDIAIATTAIPQANNIEILYPTETSKIPNTETGIVSHITKIIDKQTSIALKNAENQIVSKVSPRIDSKVSTYAENSIDESKTETIHEGEHKKAVVKNDLIDFFSDILDSKVEEDIKLIKLMDIPQESSQIDASTTFEQTFRRMKSIGVIPIPEEFSSTRKDNHFDKPLFALLTDPSHPVLEARDREKFKRRFEVTNTDNVLSLNDKFLVSTEKMFEGYPQSSFDKHLKLSDQVDSAYLPSVDLPVKEKIPTLQDALLDIISNVFTVFNKLLRSKYQRGMS